MSTIRLAKQALRKEIKAKIATLTTEERFIQSKAVTKQLLESHAYVNANSISIYLHMDDEIQTLDILKDALG